MKDIRPAVRALLLGNAQVNNLSGGRMYSVQIKQGERNPSLVYRRITDASDYHMQGDSGLQQTFMQIDAWALNTDLASALADAAHDVLSGFRGIVPYGSPTQMVDIRLIAQVNGRDLFDEVSAMFRMSRDYNIFWAET